MAHINGERVIVQEMTLEALDGSLRSAYQSTRVGETNFAELSLRDIEYEKLRLDAAIEAFTTSKTTSVAYLIGSVTRLFQAHGINVDCEITSEHRYPVNGEPTAIKVEKMKVIKTPFGDGIPIARSYRLMMNSAILDGYELNISQLRGYQPEDPRGLLALSLEYPEALEAIVSRNKNNPEFIEAAREMLGEDKLKKLLKQLEDK